MNLINRMRMEPLTRNHPNQELFNDMIEKSTKIEKLSNTIQAFAKARIPISEEGLKSEVLREVLREGHVKLERRFGKPYLIVGIL